MNNYQTIEKLKLLYLSGMVNIHKQHVHDNLYSDYTLDQYLSLLADEETDLRQDRKVKRLLQQANFATMAAVEDIDFHTQRKLDKNQYTNLSSLKFIRSRENIILTGPTGMGKSYLAQVIGVQACKNNYKVKYAQTSKLLNQLKLSKLDGTYLKELKKLETIELLILDDFGLQALDTIMREALLNIVQDRHDKKSTIIVSQIPVNKWYDLIGEATIADAILDRLVHSSHRIDLNGESYRKKMSTINR
jgi:DNA replication protein DnaC